MFIPTVSFGKKTEIGRCEIADKESSRPVKASFVKFDCKDLSDAIEIQKLGRNLKFNKSVANKMLDVHYRQRLVESPYNFYALETENGDIAGYAQTKSLGKDFILDYIESERENKYKYVGKNLISCLSAEALKNGKDKIYVPNPIESARGFYKKCGFKETKNQYSVILNKSGMKKALKSSPIDYFA